MLVVLEAAGMLVNRVAPEWYLSPSLQEPHRGLGAPQRADGPRRRPDGPRRRPILARVAGGIVHLASTAWSAYQSARMRRDVIRELSAKDDRLLADIGISREQIPEVADGLVAGKLEHPTRLVRAPEQVRYDDSVAEGSVNDNRWDKAA